MNTERVSGNLSCAAKPSAAPAAGPRNTALGLTSRLAWWLAALLMAGLVGCGSPSTPAGQSDVGEADDALDAADAPDVPDVLDIQLGGTDDATQCPGSAGCSCTSNTDCATGLCVETAAGTRCAVLCSGTCPAGFVCRSTASAGDPISYCAPVGVRQCAPCQINTDCNAALSVQSECVSAGNAGSFCASTCQTSADCPAGTTCQTSPASGTAVCAPPAGLASCACSAWAQQAKASTKCSVAEGTQACPGSRACGAEGLGPCSKLPDAVCVDAGCKDATDGSSCDDGDPCTTDTTCQSGMCGAGLNICECQTSADCNDKNDSDLCNGSLYCDPASNTCKVNPATVVSCPAPENPCETSTCTPASGQCQTTSKPNGSVCDDGDPCTQSECQAGSCVVTDDDLCGCKSTADCADDGNLCNGKPFCDKSVAPYVCKTNPASVVSCPQPADACQLALCDPATGSCSKVAAPDNTPCNDGAACTVGDVCVGGSCVPGTVTCDCASDADCAPYEDGNQCNGTLFCNKVSGKCQVNPKTVVQCPTGLDTACQQTVCVPKTGACELALAPTTTLCDDGNPCSGGDRCDGQGGCVSNTQLCPCVQDSDCAAQEDGNLCNGTLYCELTSNTCAVNPATVVLCPDAGGNPCAPIACQPTTGECQASPVLAGSCDDGDPCTAPGSCVQGACVAGPQICQCKTQADCAVFDDANPCNGTFFCDTSVGQCKANLAAVPVCPPALDACLVNACDPQTGGCKQTPAKTGTQCQDGEACTKNDSCQDGVCTPGVSVCACLTDADCASQDDGDPCNGWWFCNKEVGAPECAFNPQPKVGCADVVDGPDAGGGGADAVDVADVVDGSDAEADVVADGVADILADSVADSAEADADAGGDVASDADAGEATDAVDGTDGYADCAGASDGTACDDGNACTTADQCNAGTCTGTTLNCDDGYPKSTDSCDPLTGCTYLWPEVCDGQDNDGNGKTDDVVCGSGACTCGANGVATCPADCTDCPDDGDLAILIDIDDAGTKQVVCAHDYSAWGVVAEAPTTLTNNGDDTVSDSKTGLMWQLTISASTYTWSDAKAYCDGLTLASKKDWRLPTQFELESLVDFARTSAPTIATPLVSATPSAYFWSATSFQGGSSSAWDVNFSLGSSYSNVVTNYGRVRCVR